MGRIKYLVMDVDGTLTDGKIYIANTGEFMKAFDIKDGYGIYAVAPDNGITPVIITGRRSEIVAKRCEELRIQEVHQGVGDKLATLKSIVEDLSQVAYIGDDLNDIPCMTKVKEAGGIIGAPADAIMKVLELSDFVATHKAGEGAVREFIDWLAADEFSDGKQ